MPQLIRMMIVTVAGGFSLGFVVSCVFIQKSHGIGMFLDQPAAAAMLVWGFGASFAMGALGSRLALFQHTD